MPSKIRSRIVIAAVECFARRGYHGCSTKEIALRADVTEGSLFRLCISKDNLFAEALALAMSAERIHSTELRLILFALLERKGLTRPNRRALRRFAVGEIRVARLIPLLK